MIWYLLIVVIITALMGFFQVPIWLMYSILLVLLLVNMLRNPLLFGRNPDKIMSFLKKSKRPYLQYLYHVMNYDFPEAEKAIQGIKSEKSKRMAELMLFMERKQFGQAKELLAQIGETKTKWFATAYIALYENDAELFRQNKDKITDIFLLQSLEVEQAVLEGKRDEAVAMLDAMIPKLKGYKLLAMVQFRKHILDGTIDN